MRPEIPLHPLWHTPRESRRILLNTIRANGETELTSLRRMARRERLYFGPEEDIYGVLVDWKRQGKISIEMRGFSGETERPRIMVFA